MTKYYNFLNIILYFILVSATLAEESIYFSDMTQVLPADAITTQSHPFKWQLIEYEAEGIPLTGTMIGAASFVNAPEVVVPLNLTGWYSIYLGYWNPGFDDDGSSTILKAKLTGDAAFRQIHDNSVDTCQATFLREVFFENANLTDKDIIVAKANGLRGKKCYLAYIKAVPISSTQVQAIEQDRAQTDTRNLVATIDGMSYFHYSEFGTIDQIKEQVALYKYSDVGKVLWAINYGDEVNFNSSVRQVQWKAGNNSRIASMVGPPSNDYTRGEKQMFDSLRNFDANGLEYLNEVAGLVHDMGLKFDVMARLGILAGVLPDPNNYTNKNLQYRQRLKDGTFIGKASYAYPEVRQFMRYIIQDAATRLDLDGINLCFVRGPSFLSYEQPIIDVFMDTYNIDPRELPSDDPRIGIVRASFMTQFVNDVRLMLNTVGDVKGKYIELGVWVWPWEQNTWLGSTPLNEGLDVQTWIEEGLVDSVICQEGIDPQYMQLCNENGVEFILFTGYSGENVMTPESVTEAYNAGVEKFAIWDIDSRQIFPNSWSWIRRIGHRTEMAQWNQAEHQIQSIKLKTVFGRDVLNGLSDSVYFGR